MNHHVEPQYLNHSRPHHYGYKTPVYHPNSYSNHYGTIDDYGNAQHGFSFVSPFAGYGYFGRRRSDYAPPPPPPPHYAQSRDVISVLNQMLWKSFTSFQSCI